MKTFREIDVNRVRELFDYDPETGVFTRKVVTVGHRRVGEVVGSKHAYGYLVMGFDNQIWPAHRVAYAYVHGAIANDMDVDHVNGVRDDNRSSNLRLATRSENCQNQKRAHRDNPHGHRGVTWHKKTQKYAAQIMVGRKNRHLGLFSTVEEAAEARIKAERDLHPFSPLNKSELAFI